MKPADICRLHSISSPTLSPDGGRAVFVLTRPDLEEDAYLSSLWSVPTDGSEQPMRLTRGDRDSGAVHSPDGRWIAFLRPDQDKRPQIHVLPADGGEPWKITDHPLGAESPAWSPDSTRITYTARIPQEGRYTEGTPGKEPPRRITTLMYRVDGLGFFTDRRRQIFVSSPIDPSGQAGEPVQVTDTGLDHSGPRWTPDGTELVFEAAESQDTDLVVDLWACAPVEGAEPRRITDGRTGADGPVFSEDGATVYFRGEELGEDLRDFVGRTVGLWSAPLDGSAAPTRLTSEKEGPHIRDGLVATRDGVLLRAENRGAVDLLHVPFTGGEPTVLVAGPVETVAADHRGGTTVAVVADGLTTGELVRITPEGAEPLTSFASSEPDPLPVTELTATAPDGHPVHGWVALPEGPGPHPVVLMIHGGPFTQYGHQLFDETQVYAAAGYAVVLCNPRGSSGYGFDHGRAIIGSVGAVSATDVLAFLDTVLEDERLDSSRVGVMGGSHGGFMTTWIAAHHGGRFRAAISERAVNAIDSFHGSSDIGSFFPHPLYGPEETWKAESPLTYADDIDVPMLIIHSEEDWRCPVEQAQRLFVSLKRRGHDAEMLLFPGEGHELSRAGLPSHRVARFEAILEWWQRHL